MPSTPTGSSYGSWHRNGSAASAAGCYRARCLGGEIVPRLNQIIAVEKGVKSKSFADLTEAHQAVQKTPLRSLVCST
jgi:hypothetical protein